MTTPMESRYEGQFLDALDLPQGVEVPVVIESIAEPCSEMDAATKPIKSAILAFKGKTKRLILNKTNFKNLKAMFGRDPKDWIGKTVKIQRRYLDAAHGFGVQNTLCIRIIPPVGTPILKSAANFMGSVNPYGDVPQQQQPTSKKNTTSNGKSPLDLQHWLTGIKTLQSSETCAEFRATVLADCPDAIRVDVERALAEREQVLAAGTE